MLNAGPLMAEGTSTCMWSVGDVCSAEIVYLFAIVYKF